MDLTLKTGISLDYAQKILITDISCKESILDLVDNSIDAAREIILTEGKGLDERGMPASYAGFSVHLKIDYETRTFSIKDNCSGISPEVMKNRLLVIGEESNEPLSIGHFGVGLKRALLKLGRNYSISTTYGKSLYKISCSGSDLINHENPVVAESLPAEESSNTGTQIIIDNPSLEAEREIFQSESFMQSLMSEMEIRYSEFINKGLEIRCKNQAIKSNCPGVRSPCYPRLVDTLYS